MNNEDLHGQARQILEQALSDTLGKSKRPLPDDWLFHTLSDLLITRDAVLTLLQHLSLALQLRGFDGGFPPESADFFLTSTQKCGAWIGEIYNLLSTRESDGAAPALTPIEQEANSIDPDAGQAAQPSPNQPKPTTARTDPLWSRAPGMAPAPSLRPVQGADFRRATVVAVSPEPGEFSGKLGATAQRTTQPYNQASVVRVFYATDRNRTSPAGFDIRYDAGRSPGGQLNYGLCEISIPKIHKTGHLESPSVLRLEFRPDPNKHILLQQTLSLPEQDFFHQLAGAVQSSPLHDAFVFVHGFNVSFEDAARRTGQMAFDLQFAGAPIFYSWPSRGHLADYMQDETNVAWSAPHFERFLHLLAHRTGATRIHVIAHSMGNRAVCEALASMSRDPSTSLRLTHLVLAAPDIDAETFAQLASALQRLSTRITLYESANDKALQASKRLHGNPRAGEPLLVLPGLDTIDASAIDTDFLGHSYYSDNWPLLSDLHSILARDESPSTRFGLIPMQHRSGNYYSFRR